MAHELIDVVTATPTGPVEIGLGQSVNISASFTLDGPTDATVSIYGITWSNVTESVGFASQVPALPNTVYTKAFTPTSIGKKIVRCVASFNSDATPPNNQQAVNSNDITVVVKRFSEEDTVASVAMVEEEAPAAAMTEERDPGSILFTESSPAATVVFSEEEAATGGSGTAYFIVSVGDEATVGDYDLYICSPAGIDTALLEASVPAASLKFKYVICPLMPRFTPSAYYDLQRAAVSESDYWHSALPYDQTTRIATGPVHWYLKPSATLGHAIADFFIDNFGSYFDGGYSDESYGDIQDFYWTVYEGAHDYGGEGRPYWEAQWDAMFAAFFGDIKTAFGTSMPLIANTRGDTYTELDGITYEGITAGTEAAARVIFETQRTNWQNSANRYGDHVLNIAWDYNLNVAGLVYEGTTTGAAIPEVPEPFVEEESAA